MSYNIVCFCGGGMRGVLSATILKNLADSYPNILTRTNLFAGTSAGATIISALLDDLQPADIVTAYLTEGVAFFENPGSSATSPAYRIEAVYEGQTARHGLKTLNEFSQSVLFPAFNVGSATSPDQSTPWQPVLYTNLSGSPNGGAQIATAVTSSSAMPGMLGSWEGNIDGAFVHHDPTLAAMAAAINYAHVSFSDIVVICIGTGLMPNWIASGTETWGAQQWQNGDGNALSNTPALLVNGSVSPVLNAALNGTSVSLVPELAGMMLQGNYAYLNPTLDRYIPENTIDATDLEYLQKQAAQCDPQQMANALNLLKTYWT